MEPLTRLKGVPAYLALALVIMTCGPTKTTSSPAGAQTTSNARTAGADLGAHAPAASRRIPIIQAGPELVGSPGARTFSFLSMVPATGNGAVAYGRTAVPSVSDDCLVRSSNEPGPQVMTVCGYRLAMLCLVWWGSPGPMVTTQEHHLSPIAAGLSRDNPVDKRSSASSPRQRLLRV